MSGGGRRPRLGACVGVLLFLLLLLSAPAASAVDGEEVYRSKCQTCHGEDGSGRGNLLNIPDLSHPGIWTVNTKDSLVDTVMNGQREMPAFGWFMSEAEAEAALRHGAGLAGVEWSEIPEGTPLRTDASATPGMAAVVGMVATALGALLFGRRRFR